ncbi:MAG: AlkA N-terminal domain-containing protein [Actinomycetota bacterium]
MTEAPTIDRPMPAGLTDDQCYRALRARDARFDGRFIVGVRTTGIYCRPSCPTPIQPLRRNIDFFITVAAAQRSGLRACKRCRPDAVPGSPEWDTRGDLIGRAMRLIERGRLDTGSVAELASDLGVTERHLRRLMIEAVGAPPLSIARAQRAQTARTLIETTDLTFTEVAFAAGFSSLRQFNDTIRAVFDATPTKLRGGARSTPSRPGRLSIRLPHRRPLAADHLLPWWAGRSVHGVAEVDDATIRTALRLPRGTGVAELTPGPESWVDCILELQDIADLAPAVAQCRAMLDLDADPDQIDETLAALEALRPLVIRRPGLRSPGSTDGFATCVFAILGQQRSVAAARTIAGRIVERVDGPSEGEVLRPFPTAAALADADLDGLGLNGRAIETIHRLATTFTDRVDELGPGGDQRSIADELLAIKGIGPWTVNYIAMRVFGDPDVFLAGDLIAERVATGFGLDATDLEQVRPWRSYVTHHLWAASADGKD